MINSDKILKLTESDLANLVKNFYNDNYVVDQNACSSPHLILWSGRSKKFSKYKFWNKLNQLTKIKYMSPLISTVDNYSRLVSEIIKNKNIKSYIKVLVNHYTLLLLKKNLP